MDILVIGRGSHISVILDCGLSLLRHDALVIRSSFSLLVYSNGACVRAVPKIASFVDRLHLTSNFFHQAYIFLLGNTNCSFLRHFRGESIA